MTIAAICLLVVGSGASSLGLVRLVTARRRVLAPGEIPPSSGIPLVIIGDLALAAGFYLLFS